jgi:hypothetical protein
MPDYTEHWTNEVWFGRLVREWIRVIPSSYLNLITERANTHGWSLVNYEYYTLEQFSMILRGEYPVEFAWLNYLIELGRRYPEYPEELPIADVIPHWTSSAWFNATFREWLNVIPDDVEIELLGHYNSIGLDYSGWYDQTLSTIWNSLSETERIWLTNFIEYHQPLIPYIIAPFPGQPEGYLPHWTDSYWWNQPVWAWFNSMPEDVQDVIRREWYDQDWGERRYWYGTVQQLYDVLPENEKQWIRDFIWLSTSLGVPSDNSIMQGIAFAIVIVLAIISLAFPSMLAVISTVMSALGNIISNIGTAVTTITSGIYGLVTGGTNQALLNLGYTQEQIDTLTVTPTQFLINILINQVANIGAAFTAFLTAIHYDVLIAAVRIAEVISPEFRDAMRNIYKSIEGISAQLELGTTFLLLGYQSTRSLIMGMQSFIGYSYDLGQITWVQSLVTILERTKYTMRRYRNNPHRLFNDLEELIERDSMNSASNFAQTVTATLASLSRTSDEIVRNVQRTMGDLDSLRNALPENVRRWFDEFYLPFKNEWTDFYTHEYRPWKTEVGLVFDDVREWRSAKELELRTIFERLTKPGTNLNYMRELPDDVYASEARFLERYSTLPSTGIITTQNLLNSEDRINIISAVNNRPPSPPPRILTFEHEPIAGVPITEPESITTWNVGEY